jgi:hypothetical protein
LIPFLIDPDHYHYHDNQMALVLLCQLE